MNETTPNSSDGKPEVELAREQTRQAAISTAGWTAGMAVFFCTIALINEPSWPVALGVAALAAMLTVICLAIVKR